MLFLFSNLTPECKPNATKSRRLGNDDKRFVQSENEMMLQEGVIEVSTFPWRAQALIVTNERQQKRLVVDCSLTINRFPRFNAFNSLPRIDDLVSKISRFRFYSSLHMKSTYHQIPIRSEEKPYTAFKANGKLYQFCRVLFGVTNRVTCFQRTMDNIRQHNLCGTYTYVDNVVVAGKTQHYYRHRSTGRQLYVLKDWEN